MGGNAVALKASEDADNVECVYIMMCDRNCQTADEELIEMLHAASKRPQAFDDTTLDIHIEYKGGYSVTYVDVPLTDEEWTLIRSYPDVSVPSDRPIGTAVPETAVAATEPELLP